MKFFLLLSVLVLSIIAQATDLTLKENMKKSGNALKQISASINDSSKNQANAALVGEIINLFQVARNQSPDSVTNGSFADYQSLIDQEIQNLKELQSAFLKNDNAGALSIVQKINTLKKEGHDKYK